MRRCAPPARETPLRANAALLIALPCALVAAVASGCKSAQHGPEKIAAAPTATARPEGQSDVRFIAVGDTGMGNDEQRAVAAAMQRTCAAEGCDFVLLLGDNLYMSGAASADDPQWGPKFEQPYSGLSLPFWAVLGNHDYGHRGLGDDFARPEGELAYARRKDSKFRMPARRYQFTHGPLLFVGLDTNAARYGRDEGQKAEVAGWLDAKGPRWKIAFGHHPYLSNGPHGNAGDYEPDKARARALYEPRIAAGTDVKALLDEAVCGKADVYLSGHDHSLQWLDGTCAGTELAVSGGGAEATPVTARNPARFQQGALGFLYVAADATSLKAKFICDRGQILFERSLGRVGPP